jgi:hypothetical protein
METKDEILRGSDAKRILEDKVYIDSFETVKAGIVNSMSLSALGDTETHNRLVIALQLLEQLKKALTDVMLTGEMAELQVKDKKKGFFG